MPYRSLFFVHTAENTPTNILYPLVNNVLSYPRTIMRTRHDIMVYTDICPVASKTTHGGACAVFCIQPRTEIKNCAIRAT